MRKLSATDVARNFSKVLDSVEADGEAVFIERRGRVVARIMPAAGCSGRALKDFLLEEPHPDPAWGDELRALRDDLVVEARFSSD